MLGLLTLLVGTVLAAELTLKTTIWVADQWDPPEVVVATDGRLYVKPAVPAAFKEEQVGMSVGLRGVSVHQAGRPGAVRQVTLRTEDGQEVQTAIGREVKLGKERYRVVAEHGGFLYLQARAGKQVWRFRPAA
jgi:hypothetical protein